MADDPYGEVAKQNVTDGLRRIERPEPVPPPFPVSLTVRGSAPRTRDFRIQAQRRPQKVWAPAMKVRSSLKSLKTRHRDCKIVRRKGRVYVINKVDPRYKAKQG